MCTRLTESQKTLIFCKRISRAPLKDKRKKEKDGNISHYLDEDSIPPEQLQLLHCFRMHRNHRVIVIDRFIHNQSVWRLLSLQNRCREIPLRALSAGERG